jgi:TRAP transporter TAXI family solute receptor
MKRIAILLFVIITAVALTACGTSAGSGQTNSGSQEPAATVQTKYMTIGSGAATTAIYPYWVAIGKAISSVYPEYEFTVSETQGAMDIANRIRSGEVDFGNGVASSDFENYMGTGAFEGDPNKDSRVLWYYGMTVIEVLVSQESGITTFSELDGQRYNFGGVGTSMAQITEQIIDISGAKVLPYESNKNDAVDAYGNKQIVGLAVSGSIPNSTHLQMASVIPVRILPVSDELMAKCLDAMPFLVPGVIKAGEYDDLTEDVQTVRVMQGCQSSAAVSQEDGYKFIKAVYGDGKSIWAEVTPAYATEDEVELLLNSPIPLHAGAVQWLVENGRDVPAELIPPEYQPV